MNPMIKYLVSGLIILLISGIFIGLGLQLISYGVIFWSLGPSDPAPLITIQWWGISAIALAFLLAGLGAFLLSLALRHVQPSKS